jgi:hypothetical protein
MQEYAVWARARGGAESEPTTQTEETRNASPASEPGAYAYFSLPKCPM